MKTLYAKVLGETESGRWGYGLGETREEATSKTKPDLESVEAFPIGRSEIRTPNGPTILEVFEEETLDA